MAAVAAVLRAETKVTAPCPAATIFSKMSQSPKLVVHGRTSQPIFFRLVAELAVYVHMPLLYFHNARLNGLAAMNFPARNHFLNVSLCKDGMECMKF